MSNVLDGEKGVKVQNNNNNDNLPTLLVYYPIDTGSHYWGVIYMTYQWMFFITIKLDYSYFSTAIGINADELITKIIPILNSYFDYYISNYNLLLPLECL